MTNLIPTPGGQGYMLAQILAQQGGKALQQPIETHTEGLGALAQQLAGAYLSQQAVNKHQRLGQGALANFMSGPGASFDPRMQALIGSVGPYDPRLALQIGADNLALITEGERAAGTQPAVNFLTPNGLVSAQRGTERYRALIDDPNAVKAGDATQGDQRPFSGKSKFANVSNLLVEFNEKFGDGTAQPSQTEIQAYQLAVQEHEVPLKFTLPDGTPATIQKSLPPRFIRPEALLPQGEAGTGAGGPGVRITPIGEQKPKSPEAAGKIAALAGAKEGMIEIKRRLLDEDGSINRTLLTTMVTSIPFLGKGIPFTEGRELRSVFEDAIEAKLRAETGAAAPEPEKVAILERFLPSLLDDDATILSKMDRLMTFLDTALDLSQFQTAPNGDLPAIMSLEEEFENFE